MSRSDAGTVRARRLAGVFCGAALLAAGCATPVAPTGPGEQGRAWAGRFAVTWTPESPPPREERASGRFTLREAGDRTELEVFSPFGQTVARALAQPGSAVLETADGRRLEAGNPEALTESVLGWRAPVQQLPGWLRGDLPDQFVDSGWRISVDAREGGRPQRLTLTWPAEVVASAWRTVTIRLLLDPQDPAAGAAGAR
jgi:outer membrane lipoprotein LolB